MPAGDPRDEPTRAVPAGSAAPVRPRGPSGPRPGQYYVPAPSAPAPEAPPVVRPPSGRSPGGRPPGGRGPSGPPAARAPEPRRRRRLRPRWRWLYLYLPLALLAVALVAGWWVWSRWQSIERVELGSALATPVGAERNYLLVGSDARDDPPEGSADAEVAGRRADTMIVLRITEQGTAMMSVPRDLWATNAETGDEGKINGAYNQGPANLVRTITSNLGVPIHHYVEIGFSSFSDMVDAMGGITIDFEHPAFDRQSGLNVISDGPVTLDGPNALAYVRSRNYTEIVDGEPRTDPTADLGRQERQQTFIRTVLAEAGRTRNPVTLARLAGAAGDGVRLDTAMGFGDAWRLARRLGGGDPETVVLPTEPARRGGAAVLLLDEAAAPPVLERFGAGG